MIWEKLSPRSMWFLVGGNQALALSNGDEIIPAMLHAVRGAQKANILGIGIYWVRERTQLFAIVLSECTAQASRFTLVAACIVGIGVLAQSRLDQGCTS